MKASEIREFTDDQIVERIAEAEREIFRLGFRKAYQELENPALLRQLRRDVARLKTIRHERRLAETAGAAE
ncbi:MAG: 50S ribosomal protein L29 [Candidatus Palauibacterales bacterium]|nr:50S ribosomal protein L29 [Candidatus Palauibacterales bacterium]MDP2529899.1 50S ribosomal protein L29 [Candidatus Palauibacterales bacterium]MDP2584757.1 50S ribosomal protein L29 [Candidatus Palauibacterales bacterium]